jgi:DNA anti-recombination protein RmuC
MPVDTLKAAKRLQEGDTFSPEQAERIAEILSDLDVASATKDDLDAAEQRLDNRIDELESRLDNRIDELESRLETRTDELESRLETRTDELESRLNQRIELSEERLGQRIEERHTATVRTVVSAVAAGSAFLAVVIPLSIYLIG